MDYTRNLIYGRLGFESPPKKDSEITGRRRK
jgi:hypothetical protein